MKTHLTTLSLVALAALSGRNAAQQLPAPFPLPEVHPAPALEPGSEVLHVTYDVQRGRIRDIRSEPWGRIGLGNTPCYDNSELGTLDPGNTSNHWVTPHPGEELVSWGFKLCRESGLVRRVTIGFGSNAIDPSAGGPGGAISFALYQGTEGFGVLGTEVFRRTISGLPNNHGHLPMFLTIDFGTQPLRLADGNIGWGFLQLDGVTGPFLVRAPKRILGTANAMDLYAIGPASRSEYLGTFNYSGGCTDPFFSLCASQWLQLEEVPAREVAASVIRNGSGVNPVLLHETLPARLGELWAANLVALDSLGRPLPTVLFLSNSAFGPQPSRFGELLIDLAQQVGSPRIGTSGYTGFIPANLALAGRRIFMQGFVQDPAGEFLTNSLRVTVGY
jgi:hypothetical protein